MKIILSVVAGLIVILGSVLAFSSYDRIPEGNVGILTEWGQAKDQVGPGFQWKNPLSQDFVIIDVRERRSSPTMSVSAQELPITAIVSFNWAVEPSAARRIFVEYGSINDFESRAVLPVFQQAVKSAIGGFSATDILTRRGDVALAVETEVRRSMERLPIKVASLQIDDVTLPETYMEAVRRREEARQQTEEAEQRLRLQRVEAQRQVQEAEAAAQATKAAAEAALVRTRAEAEGQLALAQAEAEGIRAIGQAKADALKAEADALTANPTLVELERARRWSGDVPSIVIGEGSNALPFLDIARMRE